MRRAMAMVGALGLAGCMMSAEQAAAPMAEEAEADFAMAADRGGGGAMPAAAAPAPKKERKRAQRMKGSKNELASGMLDLDDALEGADGAAPADGEGGATPTRAWFPETFLFAPATITDAAGRAELDVKVPDRLTTWRVLALAHSRAGAQAGAVARFRSTLPVYVDPVVPAFLRVGDEAAIPVQVVNTTDAAIRATVKVQVEGATLVRGGGPVVVPAMGSVVQPIEIRAGRPGLARLTVSVAGRDAVTNTIEVQALGRPWSTDVGGNLASPRTVTLGAPEAIEPHSAQVRLQVFPGALALLRSELGVAAHRSGARGQLS